MHGNHYDLYQHGFHVGTMNYSDGRWEIKLGANFGHDQKRNELPAKFYVPFCPLTTHAPGQGVNPGGTWWGGYYDTYAVAEAKAAEHGHPEAFVETHNAAN